MLNEKFIRSAGENTRNKQKKSQREWSREQFLRFLRFTSAKNEDINILLSK